MNHAAADTLQDIHTATNDVLKGYREMASRAKPDIQSLILRLIDMHERHANEQAAQLAQDRDAEIGDTSLQGSVNKAVVILRDLFTDLDRDSLPAVRKGEEALRDEYVKALNEKHVAGDPALESQLKSQLDELQLTIAGLPRD